MGGRRSEQVEALSAAVAKGLVLALVSVGLVAASRSAARAQDAVGDWRLAADLNVARGYHASALLPAGDVLVAGGEGGGATAEIYDLGSDTWRATAPMRSARAAAAVSRLHDGSVVVVGGYDNTNWHVLDDAERYDPTVGVWRSAGKMSTPRTHSSVTALPDGTLLVVGGRADLNGPSLSTAERFDPATGLWTPTGTMRVARSEHSATLLADGRVLITGGASGLRGQSDPVTATSELYDPVTGAWSDAAPMSRKRAAHAALRLPDGRVLVGGSSGGRSDKNYGRPEIYDPLADAWLAVAPTDLWLYASAVQLPDGRVLFAGGAAELGDGPRQTVLYDPVADRWSPGPRTVTAHAGHSLLLLSSGEAFIVAGTGAYSRSLSRRSERFDPSATPTAANTEQGIWQAAAATRWSLGAATVGLADGKVLMAGGGDSAGSEPVHAETQVYDPAADTWTDEPPMNTARARALAALLPGGKVLVAGGETNSAGDVNKDTLDTTSAELRDPVTGVWTPTGAMQLARRFFVWGVLGDGRVLVVGGNSASSSGVYTITASTEVYDPAQGVWSLTDALGEARDSHTATTLSDGRLLIAGGFSRWGTDLEPPVITRSAEIYDPTSNTWSSTGEMSQARAMHAAALLADGRILVGGGFTMDAAGNMVTLATAELYNPATGRWTATGRMVHPRTDTAMARLASGEVLVVAGRDDVGALDAAEIFDPARGRWQATARLAQARRQPACVVLADGRVWVAGDRIEDVRSVEIFARSAKPTPWFALLLPRLIRSDPRR